MKRMVPVSNRDHVQGSAAARVHEDVDNGTRSGVRGTPIFFINGVLHDDTYTMEVLLPAIKDVQGTP